MSRIETGNEGSTKAKELAYPILFIANIDLYTQYINLGSVHIEKIK